MQTTLGIDGEIERIGLTKDRFQTPPEAVRMLFPILHPNWRYLDPCAGEGNIVNTLRQSGMTAFGFDIEGESPYSPFCKHDFLRDAFDYSDIDCIVTNPPYSDYGAFIARAVEIGKPFAMLVPDSYADSLERFQILQTIPSLSVIVPPRRIAFKTPAGRTGTDSKPQFMTVWLCSQLSVPQGAKTGMISFMRSMD